jgi:hypothetical protein
MYCLACEEFIDEDEICEDCWRCLDCCSFSSCSDDDEWVDEEV